LFGKMQRNKHFSIVESHSRSLMVSLMKKVNIVKVFFLHLNVMHFSHRR